MKKIHLGKIFGSPSIFPIVLENVATFSANWRSGSFWLGNRRGQWWLFWTVAWRLREEGGFAPWVRTRSQHGAATHNLWWYTKYLPIYIYSIYIQCVAHILTYATHKCVCVCFLSTRQALQSSFWRVVHKGNPCDIPLSRKQKTASCHHPNDFFVQFSRAIMDWLVLDHYLVGIYVSPLSNHLTQN